MKVTSKSTSTSGCESKSKFAVGDRVAIYQNGYRYLGTIIEFGVAGSYTANSIRVKYNGDGGSKFWLHAKQLRKLKPKKKLREIWIKTDGALSALSCKLEQDVYLGLMGPPGQKGWIRFRECK